MTTGLLDHLLFEHFDKFKVLIVQYARKLNIKFSEKMSFANKMGIFLYFKCHFHGQSYIFLKLI